MVKVTWEQPKPDGQQEVVDDVVQQYLRDDPIPADGPGPGPNAASGQQVASAGEGSEIDPQLVERVLEQLGLDNKFAALRQELQGYADRTAQSFSDKTASRLSASQKAQMASVELILAPLREQLGPDYDAAVRRAKMNVMIAGNPAAGVPGTEVETETPGLGQPVQGPSQPAGQEANDVLATAYLTAKLGDPSGWPQKDVETLHSDLAQARDLTEWMATVERYAVLRSSTAAIGARAGARAQPVGAPAGRKPQPSLERLGKAYNRAAEVGDMDAMNKIGAQIDAARLADS